MGLLPNTRYGNLAGARLHRTLSSLLTTRKSSESSERHFAPGGSSKIILYREPLGFVSPLVAIGSRSSIEEADVMQAHPAVLRRPSQLCSGHDVRSPVQCGAATCRSPRTIPRGRRLHFGVNSRPLSDGARVQTEPKRDQRTRNQRTNGFERSKRSVSPGCCRQVRT